jgi:choline kinase
VKAVILAAGLGERLGRLTSDKPKALVHVDNRELILRVLDFLDHPAVTSKAIVVGYLAERFKSFLKENNVDATVLYNPHFKQGSIRTIETALPFLDDEFLLMNVDHVYPKRMLPVILNNRKGITAVCDFDRTLGADDMKIKLNENRSLTGIKKTLTDYDGGYIGMTYCDRDNLNSYKQAVVKTRETFGDSAPVEWALGHMVNQGRQVNICDASGLGWLEVDTSEDLDNANKKLTNDRNFLR